MPPTPRRTTQAKETADRDPATGAPTTGPAATPPADPATADATPDPDAPDAPAGDGSEAGGVTPGAADPDAPVPAVDAQGGPQDDLRPVGDTGAANPDDDLAGGMHEASEALDAELSEDFDEPSIRKRAFTDNGDQTVTVTRDVYASFVPANAKRTSTILLFPKGQRFARGAVARRIAMYEGRDGASVHYGSE